MDSHSWLSPTTAFTVACAAFSILAVSTVWRNQQSAFTYENKRKEGTDQRLSQRGRRVAVDSLYAADSGYAAAFERPPKLILQDTLQHLERSSQQLRGLHFADSRWIVTSILGEISLLTTSICRLQQQLSQDVNVMFGDLGHTASFNATLSSINDVLALLENELKESAASPTMIQEALQQLRQQRPALQFLLETGEGTLLPHTLPSEVIGASSFGAYGVGSATPMPPFIPSTSLTPGGETKCWIEPPPEYSPPTIGRCLIPEKEKQQQIESAPLQAQDQRNEEYDTDALYNAVSDDDVGLVNDLLALGTDPNAIIGGLKRTALHQAAHLNHTTSLTALLRNGASMSVEDSNGDTPLHLAAWAGNCDAIDILLTHGAEVDWLSGRDGYSPLWCAISAYHINAARLLLEYGARVSLCSASGGGMSPLHQAAVTGQAAMCELLLERGAHVGITDDDRNNPLHYAAACGSAASVKVLLRHGADVAAMQAQGLTPAHWASHKDHTEVLDILLKHGADINARTGEGATPLHLAANRGNIQTARFLLEKGANVQVMAVGRDGFNGSAAEMARAKGHTRLAKLIDSWPSTQ